MWNYVWQEMYGDGPGYAQPGGPNGYFIGGYPNTEASDFIWKIAPLKNSAAATDEDNDSDTWTFTINYNQLRGDGVGGSGSNIRFYVNYEGLVISSTDLVLTTHATYNTLRDGDRWVCHEGETVYGYGTNNLSPGSSFTFSGLLLESDKNSSGHWGHQMGTVRDGTYVLVLEYTPSAVPIPAGV